MNIIWPTEDAFEYDAHTKLLKEGKEEGVNVKTYKGRNRKREQEKSGR